LRLGILARNLEEQGGIAVYTRQLIGHLLALDHVDEYFLFYGSEHARGMFDGHPNVHEIVLPCRSKLWWDQVQVARKANALHLDAVFCPKMSIPFLFHGRKLLTIHGAEQFVLPEEFPWSDRVYVRLLLPLYARAADCVITVSQTSRDDLAPLLGVSKDHFRITPHGAKEIYLDPVPAGRKAEVRARYGLEGDFVLHVGLVWGAKNYDIFPEVLERVNDERPMVLAHAGRAYRWGDAEASAERSPYLRELGFVPDEDLAALYQSAVALVFPSLYEGFGIPLVEAMASGCPVITSGWGAMKEVTGDAALHVDSRDAGAIAHAILELADSPGLRSDLAVAGRERAALFSWDESARRTLDVFREIVGT
jgi:glycosyltransferase involved in cell wall biosynthesis